MNPQSLILPDYIKTDRLVLRPFTAADTPALHKMHKNSKEMLHKWWGTALSRKNLSEDDIISYINKALSGWYDRSWLELAAFEKHSGDLIGTGVLHTLDWSVPKGRIGYIIDKDKQGKGYATEIANVMTRYAFEVLKLERLEIRTSTQNPASYKIPRRLNYQFLTVFEKNKRGADGALWGLEIHVRFDTKNLPNLNINWQSP